MFLRVGNLEEWQKILLCITANSGGKQISYCWKYQPDELFSNIRGFHWRCLHQWSLYFLRCLIFDKIQIMNCLANENIYWKPINLQDTSVHVRILPTEDKSYNIGKYPTLSVFWRWWFRWRVWSCCIQWFLPGVLLGSNYGSSQF